MNNLYRSREVVHATQYTGESHSEVQIGKNDSTDRWDDTPDGPYIILANFHAPVRKIRIKPGDWIIKLPEVEGVQRVVSDKLFKLLYESIPNQA